MYIGRLLLSTCVAAFWAVPSWAEPAARTRDVERSNGEAKAAPESEAPSQAVASPASTPVGNHAALSLALMLARPKAEPQLAGPHRFAALEAESFRKGDLFQFAVTPNAVGRIYIVHEDAKGALTVLYPRSGDASEEGATVQAGQRVLVPDPEDELPWLAITGANEGPEQLHVFFTRDLARAPEFSAVMKRRIEAKPQRGDPVLAQLFPRGVARSSGEGTPAKAESTVVDATAPDTVWYSIALRRVD